MVDTKFDSLYELIEEEDPLYDENGTLIQIYRDRSNKTKRVAVKYITARKAEDKKRIEKEIAIL